MDEVAPDLSVDYVELTAGIVSAYISNNFVPVSELGNLLASVHPAVSDLAAGGPTTPSKGQTAKPTAACRRDEARRINTRCVFEKSCALPKLIPASSNHLLRPSPGQLTPFR